MESLNYLGKKIKEGGKMKVSVGISSRHLHVTKEHLEILFGKDFELEIERPINQIGQYASKSFVTLKSDKGIIEHVRILGPTRPYTQIEISKTDAYKLKIDPPVRMSGDVKGSQPITLIGPKGTLELKEGCIIADRHIHMLPKQAEMYGFTDDEEVMVKVPGEKACIMDCVKIRVADNSYFEMHIDNDDANANLINNGDLLDIIKKK